MLLLLLCVVYYNVGFILSCKSADLETTDVFDFVVCPDRMANRQGKAMFHVSGTIKKHEKFVKIPITIPYCQALVFVRVEVDNPVAPPAVYLDVEYNQETIAVIIKYRPNQDSESSYVIAARTTKYKDCNSRRLSGHFCSQQLINRRLVGKKRRLSGFLPGM
ncbi:hypothetical protein ABMA28_016454 [Loxostege sticticalis]|uniref:Uncharacterized protein n=1 Tax=Loxostege sticticalis TaxID=481309 RepID=A0ABD0TBX1_LOXSC